jgi:hypothetical protein
MDIEKLRKAYDTRDWLLVAEFYKEVTGKQISSASQTFKISYDWRGTSVEEGPNRGITNENH